MDKVIFFLLIMPVMILKEGYNMLTKDIDTGEFWSRVAYVLLVALCILFIVLWAHGYRL